MARNARLENGPGRFKSRDGLSLWYRVAGRGPAVLVPAPGWGASTDMYMKSLGPLERHFTLVYFDTRGAGRSDKPKKRSGWQFSKFLGDIERLRAHLRLDHWMIFAHSDATLQALGYAIKHPRKCHGLFIVCGTMNDADAELRADVRRREHKLEHEPWYAAAAAGGPTSNDDEFRESFLNIQLPLYFASATEARKAKHYFSASTYRVKGNRYDELAPSFPPRRLARVRAPTAVFCGDRDIITTPLEAIRLESGIPNSMLFVIRDAGHFPWLQRRDVFFRDFAQAAAFVRRGHR